MANVKITELTADTNPASTDVLPIVDVSADATKKVTIADLLENAGNGSEGAPAFSFDSDPDTGMLRSAANSLGFATGGTQRLVIDSSGNVGIGTSSPSTRFHLTGTDDNFITVDHTTRTGSWIIKHSGNDSENLDFRQNNGSTTVRSYLAGRDIHEFHTNGSERLRIDSSGRVGIGTSSLSEKLTLGGETNPTVRIHTSQQNDSWNSSSEFGKLQFYSNDFEYNGGGEMASISVGVANTFGSNPSIRFKTTTSRADGANPAERMRITSAGNVLLGGTASPASATKSLAIFNGTAPTGSVADGVVLYAEDVSSSSELKVRDEAGNVTTLSPHNFNLIPEGPSEDMAWSYYSEKDGKRINVDMLKAVRLLEQLTGEQLVFTG